MNRRDDLIARTRQGYCAAFGADGPHPRRFFAAPGRVNLIGEHVDYNDGYVLPCAIDRETIVAIGPGVEGRHVIEPVIEPVIEQVIEVVAIDMGNARDRFALDEPIVASGSNWQNLVRGVAAVLQKRGHILLPCRMAIAGDVPIGAGLSSSASFAVATALAITQFCCTPLTAQDLALVAQEAENDFLGTRCGIMDQMASSASASAHALLLDCRSLESTPIPVAKDLAVVIIDSGVRRELASSAFNQRRAECESAAKALGAQALRDVTADALEKGKYALLPEVYSRARHVVSEIARVKPMAAALARGDTAGLAAIMDASHASLRDDYEVTVPQVDRLQRIISAALNQGTQPLGGVRMTGAGFGGCLVAVVKQSAVAQVLKAVERDYNPHADIPASADVYAMAGGAREVSPQ